MLTRNKDVDLAMDGYFMESHGSQYVALTSLLGESRNLLAGVVCLKAHHMKLRDSADPRQLLKDTRRKISSTAGAVCPVDLMTRFSNAVSEVAKS